MSSRTFTAREIAQIIDKSKRTIEMRAVKENWPFIEEIGRGRGGKTKKYPLSGLPEEVRKKIKFSKTIKIQSSALFDWFLNRPGFYRARIYFLYFAAGFLGKVIFDIINR